MRSKTPLALMEQAIMVLVFALAAALCLRAFVLADHISRQNQLRDQAILQAECAAETLKHVHGDLALAAQTFGGTWKEETWSISYGSDWQLTEESPSYILSAFLQDSGSSLLGQALIQVTDGEELLFELSAFWQEVDSDGS